MIKIGVKRLSFDSLSLKYVERGLVCRPKLLSVLKQEDGGWRRGWASKATGDTVNKHKGEKKKKERRTILGNTTKSSVSVYRVRGTSEKTRNKR